MEDETKVFFGGVLVGVAVLAIILAATNSTPRDMSELRNSAVSAGVAEWIVSYDSNGSPVLEFKWKQTKH